MTFGSALIGHRFQIIRVQKSLQLRLSCIKQFSDTPGAKKQNLLHFRFVYLLFLKHLLFPDFSKRILRVLFGTSSSELPLPADHFGTSEVQNLKLWWTSIKLFPWKLQNCNNFVHCFWKSPGSFAATSRCYIVATEVLKRSLWVTSVFANVCKHFWGCTFSVLMFHLQITPRVWHLLVCVWPTHGGHTAIIIQRL